MIQRCREDSFECSFIATDNFKAKSLFGYPLPDFGTTGNTLKRMVSPQVGP